MSALCAALRKVTMTGTPRWPLNWLRSVDLIVTWGTPAALAAKQATSSIPVVMGALGDPVSVGIVSNLARPNGNITGFAVDLEGKRSS
jgi:hypothetical protein